MSAVDDEAVWERVKASMPVHDCGRRLEPGGSPEVGHALVCPPCSYVATVDSLWATAQVNEAILRLTEENERG